MTSSGHFPEQPGGSDLPPFSLDVHTLDLGAGVRAVGLELLGTESREPVCGPEAAEIWASVFPALAKKEPYGVDFFSHLNRVREFCSNERIAFREAAARCITILRPSEAQLQELFHRFEKETFGVRAGSSLQLADPALENDLSHRGVDAYEGAYSRYLFCAICEPEAGWVTLLSSSLQSGEIIQVLRPVVQRFDVYVLQPQ